MGLFGQFNDLVEKAQVNINGVKNLVIPIELQNMQKTAEIIKEKLVGFEAQEATNSVYVDSLIHLRTFLMSHYGHLQQGGEPDPNPACKIHPMFKTIKDGYTELDSRLSRLEAQFLQCSFGYQNADGEILKPTIQWSEDEWHNIKSQSKDQVARCWLDANKNQYV